MRKKSVALTVILYIITFGFYGAAWAYLTAKSLQEEGKNVTIEPIVILLLCLTVKFVGYIFLALTADDNMNEIRQQRGMVYKDNKILYLVFAIIFPAVLVGIVQNDINELSTE